MSKGKSTTTTTTDPTQMAIYKDLYDRSKGIAGQPFVPYTGPRVAGFNPDQLQGFDQTRSMFDQSMGYDPRGALNNIAGMETPGVSPVTGNAAQLGGPSLFGGSNINRGDVRDLTPRSMLDVDLNAYQNPYTSQVIDNTLSDLDRARKMAVGRDQDQAIGAGAFGGSRSGILESETNRAFADQAARTSANLRQGGFDRATSLAGQDIGRDFAAQQMMSDTDRGIATQNALLGQQTGMAGMDARNRFGMQQGMFDQSTGMANLDAQNRAAFMRPDLEMQNRRFQSGLHQGLLGDQYRNLGLMSGIGGQQQGLQQAGMDAGYNEFMRALQHGPQQLGLLAQGVSALPTQTNTTQSSKPGLLDSLASAASIYSGFGFG